MSQKKEKKPKRKPKYGILSCVGYMYKLLWKHERVFAFVGFFTVPVSLGMSALTLYVPSITLRYLQTSDRFSTIALVILGLALADILLSLMEKRIGIETMLARNYIRGRMDYQLTSRLRDRDFFLDYDPQIKLLDQRARQGYQQAVMFPLNFAEMVSIVLKFFLFSSIISLLNPLILLLLAVGCAITYFLSQWERRRNYETADERNKITKKLNYLSYDVANNFKFGKDIRLYNFRDYLSLLARKLLGEYKVEAEKMEQRSFFAAFINFLVVLVRDGAAYAFLIYKAVAGEIDSAEFVLYFSAITQMSGFMLNLLNIWTNIQTGALHVSDYREALEAGDQLNRGPGIPLPKGAFSIEFKNVTFRYPGEKRNVLENISFKIPAGEKLALVGLNGAGKTTLTRLMCGLLLPTEGEILLDGHTLFEYNRDELYTLFGLVPQDYNLLPVSLAQNIACTDTEEEIDREKLFQCIRFAGLDEKVDSLPDGIATPLNRQVNLNGIELSGGEAQKLLLARLLYHSPKCIILDEPTAALDPLAEDKMYHKYNSLAAGSTSIFISHRLASTRFCDRIFLLDGAVIAETGTHAELMAAGGKYRELFDLQSKYYKDNLENRSETQTTTSED